MSFFYKLIAAVVDRRVYELKLLILNITEINTDIISRTDNIFSRPNSSHIRSCMVIQGH